MSKTVIYNPHNAAALERAIDYFGTAAELAKHLGIKSQSIHQWRTGRARVTAERAIDIERVTGGVVRREHLRPDLYREMVA